MSSIANELDCKLPLCILYSGKRLLARQLEVLNWGPLQGKTRGGESERGRMGNDLEEGPLPFWCQFHEKMTIKISMKKQSWKIWVCGGLWGALGLQRCPK